MAIYRFFLQRDTYYDVEAKSKEKALEKLENAEDLSKYSADVWEDEPEFVFDDIVG